MALTKDRGDGEATELKQVRTLLSAANTDSDQRDGTADREHAGLEQKIETLETEYELLQQQLERAENFNAD